MSFIGLMHIRSNGRATLKEMTIYDKPRFGYRGHHVDVARNFHSKETIEKTIDAMALWKVRKMTPRKCRIEAQ
jgi:hexosaminidase